ncbi:fungal fucose-specific lectin-domain-containing protein [Tuber borchii]|uniref:Fungal fucose-specific lectin-domain-containing protein n=1 Tax=Tuber borchii TaxID=42251 RepID=A0A2T6ZD79_TUBBO|nr:fungal fucose-specific lectin-domain-containing protein [Tuber borchii]
MGLIINGSYMNNIAPHHFYLSSVSTSTASANHSGSRQVSHWTPDHHKKDSINNYYRFWQNIARSGQGDNQKQPDLGSGLKPSKRKIWEMERKVFMIMLGIFILLIITMAVGVGVGVAVSKAKNNNKGLSTPTDSSPSPTSSSGYAMLVTVTPSSSPTPTPIRKNTPLVAVNWNTGYMQLLYKHTDGTIILQENNGLEWGEQSAQVTKPKDDSGLAAIDWSDGDVRQVRVYTASENNTLTESVWNSSSKLWYDQDINDISFDKVIAPLAPGSQLTAYTWFWNGVLQIRVYYQGQDGYIREAVWNGTKGWSKGDSPSIQGFPLARSGTGLAIVSFPDTNEREAKLFYQDMDGKLRSYDYKPAATWVESWQNSTTDHGSIPNGTHLAAVLDTYGGIITLRIYFIRDGKLVEIWWRKKDGWNSSNMHDAAAPGVSAVSSSSDVHVFFQAEAGYLSALVLNSYISQWQFTAII